ncbi:hypothetical protein [Streptomyces tauricus]|uniref:hypothetical protein n=1 Tax=Streptomyces tauricus TaxID=68274 RepID=UPI0022438C8D|nr:hypothetical protein [Streptomyces tauricus]MCW8103571.1 hypothetical protein [Streptomyces tauricus]
MHSECHNPALAQSRPGGVQRASQPIPESHKCVLRAGHQTFVPRLELVGAALAPTDGHVRAAGPPIKITDQILAALDRVSGRRARTGRGAGRLKRYTSASATGGVRDWWCR